ncbi:hypothetical protein AK812_SmicGene25070 [Symbiodinium microadriaticum]|uniref:Uncharacterized protein n=1 Tax=Symbiodinium microadriaticum TaxID=2951 RepID=A0A1Q9DD66_SYMMI|nr:hypothetical protein AK812_SmicGene25070 [Symbiodinium microadriaticum]
MDVCRQKWTQQVFDSMPVSIDQVAVQGWKQVEVHSVVKDLEVQRLALVQAAQVACSSNDVVPDQLDFQLAEVVECGGAVFVVGENDCDGDAADSFHAAGSLHDQGSCRDSTAQAGNSLAWVKHCAKVEVREVEGETRTRRCNDQDSKIMKNFEVHQAILWFANTA